MIQGRGSDKRVRGWSLDAPPQMGVGVGEVELGSLLRLLLVRCDGGHRDHVGPKPPPLAGCVEGVRSGGGLRGRKGVGRGVLEGRGGVCVVGQVLRQLLVLLMVVLLLLLLKVMRLLLSCHL